MVFSLNKCYLLLKPDVFIENKIKAIFHYFESRKFVIYNFRFGKCSKEHYFLMYHKKFFPEKDFWELNYKFFDFSPCLGLIIGSHNQNLYQYFKKNKGHTLLKLQKTTDLRRKFNAQSRLFNVIHVPDSLLACERESKLWFESPNPFSSLQSFSYKSILNEYNEHKYSETTDQKNVFNSLKKRLFHSIKKGLEGKKINLKMCSLDKVSFIDFSKNYKHIIPNYFFNSLYSLKKIENFLKKNDKSLSLFQYFISLLDKHNVFYSQLEKHVVEVYFTYE
jgi:nucleoside diphosphate kinase